MKKPAERAGERAWMSERALRILHGTLTLAAWFAYALAMAFATKYYGWAGFAAIASLVLVAHIWHRWKYGYWIF